MNFFLSFQMELLYLMIFGKSTNVPLVRWYLIFEKTVDAFDHCEYNIFTNFPFFHLQVFLTFISTH